MAKTAQLDENGYRKFGKRDVLAYAAGDFGCNMSFALKSYLTIFWTQYMGISATLMAGLLLMVQVWDAINDPLIGAIVDADQHKYRRNKFLSYIWLGSIGLVIAGALCFIPWPSAPYVVKCILFIVGYIAWDAFYTIANVPYGSILSLITDDPEQRAQLSTARSTGAMAAGIGISIVLPFLIYDASDNLVGDRMFIIALIMGIIGFCFFQFMIRNTEIRVDTQKFVKKGEKKRLNPFVGMGHFLRNRAAIGATILPVGQFIGMYGAQTAVQVTFQSYFHAAQISGIVGMLSYAGLFVWIPFASKVVARWGKKEVLSIGTVVAGLGYALMFVVPITPDMSGVAWYIACQLIAAIGLGCGSCVSYSLMADAMDYEEWKFGTRNEGTTYAMHSFFRKLAQGVGPSLGLVLAAQFGYDETLGSAQTAATASNMLNLVIVLYIVGAVIQFIGLFFVYNLDKKTLAHMNADLAERRAKVAAENEAAAAEAAAAE